MTVGDSVVPRFVDDDELVRAQLRRDGSVGAMVDDIKIKIRGGGDYALRLPGPVLNVADQGGDSPPGLADGRVSFLGHLDAGQRLLAAEATLDPKVEAARIPLQVAVAYHDGGSDGSGRHTFTETIDVDNVTGQPARLLKGTPDTVAWAQALDALHGAPTVYTPEINLSALYPMPASLALHSPVTGVSRQVYVPLSIDTRVHLQGGDRLVTGGGADVTVDSRGTGLHWIARLPQDSAADGRLSLSFSFTSPAPLRVPAVDMRAQVLPLPASEFEPPVGLTWAKALKTARNLADLAVLAQAGAISPHRIGDLAPPVGRPGAGPERVSYELVLASGETPKPPGAVQPPLHPHTRAAELALL